MRGEILEERGNYRVLLTPDDYADEPWDGTGPPVIRVYRDGSPEFIDHSERPLENDGAIASALTWFGTPNHRDFERKFVKYLKAYYGVTKVETWHSGEAWYITYDPADWRAFIGFPPGATLPDSYPASVNLNEWQAWANGEVYSYTVQKRVTWHTDDDDYDDETRWEDVPDGTVGGFYGYEYAKQEALDALAYEMREEGNSE